MKKGVWVLSPTPTVLRLTEDTGLEGTGYADVFLEGRERPRLEVEGESGVGVYPERNELGVGVKSYLGTTFGLGEKSRGVPETHTSPEVSSESSMVLSKQCVVVFTIIMCNLCTKNFQRVRTKRW